MSKYNIQFFAIRKNKTGQTFRFTPSPRRREAGYAAFGYYKNGPRVTAAEWKARGFSAQAVRDLDLKHITHAGAAMTLPEAIRFAQAIEAYVLAENKPIAFARRPRTQNIDDLLDAFLDDFAVKVSAGEKSKSTHDGYRWAGKHIRAAFKGLSPEILEPDDIENWYREIKRINGKRSALYAVQTLRAAWNYGRRRSEWRTLLRHLDFAEVRTEAQDRRRRVITATELDALLLAAQAPQDMTGAGFTAQDAMPCLADALILALTTTQRLNDLCAITWAQTQGGPNKDRLMITQSKTKNMVNMQLIPAARTRLALMRARHDARGYDVGPNAPVLLVSETGRPYADMADAHRYFDKRFARLRARAALLCPSVKTLWFRDTRRTALQALVDLGLEFSTVYPVSGHAPRTAHAMSDHYAPGSIRAADHITDKMAKADIGLFANLNQTPNHEDPNL
jgi:hypothetical protein